MRIEQVYYFLEAVKAGSFTQAAKNLYLQQPSLREGIINLENELGQPLLERTQRGVRLTAYGEYALPHLQLMVDTYEMLKRDTQQIAEQQKMLRIEANSVYDKGAILVNSDALYRQSAKNRDCRISTEDDKNVVINKVIGGEIDIGLIIYFEEELAHNQSLMAQKGRAYKLIDLAKYELVIYMRRDHPLARKKTLNLEDAIHYLLIFSMVSNPPILDLLTAEFGRDKFKYTVVSNLKLASKYCMKEDSLFFAINKDSEMFDDGIICRTFDRKYIQHHAAVVRADARNEEVFQYIAIIKTLMQEKER